MQNTFAPDWLKWYKLSPSIKQTLGDHIFALFLRIGFESTVKSVFQVMSLNDPISGATCYCISLVVDQNEFALFQLICFLTNSIQLEQNNSDRQQ